MIKVTVCKPKLSLILFKRDDVHNDASLTELTFDVEITLINCKKYLKDNNNSWQTFSGDCGYNRIYRLDMTNEETTQESIATKHYTQNVLNEFLSDVTCLRTYNYIHR